MKSIQRLLDANPSTHRVTVQCSMTPGYYLARLEVGDMWHGVCTHWGKGDTVKQALKGLCDAAVEDPTEDEIRP